MVILILKKLETQKNEYFQMKGYEVYNDSFHLDNFQLKIQFI
jgi:hypothetical protein